MEARRRQRKERLRHACSSSLRRDESGDGLLTFETPDAHRDLKWLIYDVNNRLEQPDGKECCAYHQTTGHDTEECRDLLRAVERLIAVGEPIRPQRDRALTTKEVSTIVGGFGGGEVTSAARKRYARAVNAVTETPFGFSHPDIRFSSADFCGIKPHLDDQIVVPLRVNQLNVQRVLLDQGGSADII
ncbi:uncharacterized protein LOC130735150 [Lotus japonicus]|uniref:uncharacterized protein LOC130735150 n=1 Tax=Lotus japonicus TaxID=34305 RepID=UPI002587C591|nr:uncharacterized protein LOC130735150 [Lotus japonicus]